MQSLRELGNMLYQTGSVAYRPGAAGGYTNTNSFSPSMNNTLNQMKNNY